MFHKLETSGNPRLQIPVFTGMTGFGTVLRFDDKVDIVNRRAMCGAILERRLLKLALETRPYEPNWGYIQTEQAPLFLIVTRPAGT